MGVMARRKAHKEEVHLRYVMKDFFQMTYGFDRWQKKKKKIERKENAKIRMYCGVCKNSSQHGWNSWTFCVSVHSHAYLQMQECCRCLTALSSMFVVFLFCLVSYLIIVNARSQNDPSFSLLLLAYC